MRYIRPFAFVLAFLLLVATAFAQDDDRPVLKRRPAPTTDSSQPNTPTDSTAAPANPPDTQPPANTQPQSRPRSTQPQSAPPEPQYPPAPPEGSQPADNTATTASVRANTDVASRSGAVMGFDAANVTRRVMVTRNGGVLRLLTSNPDDADTAGRINLHLRRVASQLTRGDLSTFASGGQAPGTAAMRQMRSKIVFTAHAIDGGAELIISSTDQKAVEAIHQFLQSQQ